MRGWGREGIRRGRGSQHFCHHFWNHCVVIVCTAGFVIIKAGYIVGVTLRGGYILGE